MIISKTPYRISFFGGGSDYPSWYNKYGGEVISTSIDKYIYISLRSIHKFFEYNYRICYSKIEQVNNISDIDHNVVRKLLNFYKINKKIEIHYEGDLPSKSGMASSSAFTVGFLNCLKKFMNEKNNKKILADECIYFEQKILKECVGSQDQIACSYGGFNHIKFKKNFFLVNKFKNKKTYLNKLNDRMVLLYTGYRRQAEDIAKQFVLKLTQEKKKEIYTLIDHVKLAKNIISQSKLDDFGDLLNETWNIKKNIDKSISNSIFDTIYDKAIQSGSLGGKMLGAGGGGFFLFYVPKEKKNKFINRMSQFQNVPFKFENEGSKIIFNQ